MTILDAPDQSAGIGGPLAGDSSKIAMALPVHYSATEQLERAPPYAATRATCILRSSFRETAEAMARRKRAPKIPKHTAPKSPYFMQPGKRGVVVVLHRACGNRVVPKVCGEMPSRTHAKMLISQLERAESVVKDLFLEATDDGIEALEAVLAACREEVLRRGPRVHEGGAGNSGGDQADGGRATDNQAGSRGGRNRRSRHGRGRRPTPEFEPPTNVRPLSENGGEPPADDEDGAEPPYNEAAS